MTRPLFDRMSFRSRNGGGADPNSGADTHLKAMPLPVLRPSTDTMSIGFAHLDDESGYSDRSVSAHAAGGPAEASAIKLKEISTH